LHKLVWASYELNEAPRGNFRTPCERSDDAFAALRSPNFDPLPQPKAENPLEKITSACGDFRAQPLVSAFIVSCSDKLAGSGGQTDARVHAV
jgi:hypothetical protein